MKSLTNGKDKPLKLTTAPGTSEYTMHVEERDGEKGLRGRFGVYLPPLMEALGLAELEHNAKNNRMRAV